MNTTLTIWDHILQLHKCVLSIAFFQSEVMPGNQYVVKSYTFVQKMQFNCLTVNCTCDVAMLTKAGPRSKGSCIFQAYCRIYYQSSVQYCKPNFRDLTLTLVMVNGRLNVSIRQPNLPKCMGLTQLAFLTKPRPHNQ